MERLTGALQRNGLITREAVAQPGVLHKTLAVEVRATDVENELEYVMSDATRDRYGDILEPSGWQLAAFKKNPVALFGHSSQFVIGKWKNVRVENDKLLGVLELMNAVTERLREIHEAVRAGVLRAVSVGFRPIEFEAIDEDDPWEGMRFTKMELVECSLVAVPANPNALAVAKSLNLSADAQQLIFGKTAEEISVLRRGLTGEPAVPKTTTTKSRTTKMNLSERIEAAQQRLTTLRDEQTQFLAGIDGDMDDTQLVQAEEFTNRLVAAQKQVDVLKAAEAAMASTTEPIAPERPAIQAPAVRRLLGPRGKEVDPKTYVYRAAALKLLSRVEQKAVPDVLRERYGEDERTRVVTDIMLKAATVPATTTLTGWALELVQTAIADFIDTLMPLSVYPGLSARGARFGFGRNGIVSLPSRSPTPTVAGSFVGQGAPIPVRQAAFTAVTLTPKKMGVISTFTREIAEHSTPDIETMIRQAIEEDTSVAIDSVLLDANAATTIRPAGLRNGVTVTTATAGGGFAALVGDIKALVGVLVAANSLRAPVWIMNPAQALSISMVQNAGGDFPFAAELANGNLRGYPVLQSTTVPAGTVILVDAFDFFSATGDEPRFDVSDQAVLHMEDTTPLAIGTTGSPNTVAAPVRSLWQTDTLGIRMLLDINWAMRRTGVIAWTESVTW